MNIEVGKYYKTRTGHKVRIYATDGGGVYPVHAGILLGTGWKIACYTKAGGEFVNENADNDIIAEWIDKPEMDISVLPKWANWISRDCWGGWYWFEAQPTQRDHAWNASIGLAGYILAEYAPKWDGDWKDSLTKIKR